MIGIVLLAHADLHRTRQLATFLADQGCRVAVHIDAGAALPAADELRADLQAHPNILIVPAYRCEWGTFSLVEACLSGLRLLLARRPDVSHVCQISGACLPIRPIPLLQKYLGEHRGTDFIECVPVTDGAWVVDGLSTERFTLYHPFAWRRHRRLFDLSVEVQRRLRIRRTMPAGLTPHIGSQWWALSRETLHRILSDPALVSYASFFRKTWIPDESFFQTLAAKHSTHIVKAPLTLVRFDAQGKPFVLHDDHLDLLLGASHFFARKISPDADRLYDTFLNPHFAQTAPHREGHVLSLRFAQAARRRTHGRRGLICQGRHPGRRIVGQHETARPFLAIDAVDWIIPSLREALSRAGIVSHGQLFGSRAADFATGQETFTGNLSSRPSLRDYDIDQFLVRLIWIERDRTQAFLHRFADGGRASSFILADPNARILRLREAWMFELFDLWRSDPERLEEDAGDVLSRHQTTAATIDSGWPRATIRTISTADCLQDGAAADMALRDLLPDDLVRRLPIEAELPLGFDEFLSDLNALDGFSDFAGSFGVRADVERLTLAPDRPSLVASGGL